MRNIVCATYTLSVTVAFWWKRGLVQEQALAQARLQFEREQEAAKGALQSFAPGFGAGKLLADAMARRTAKVTAFAESCARVSCTILSTACVTLSDVKRAL